jgi:uncharacterized membrane protein
VGTEVVCLILLGIGMTAPTEVELPWGRVRIKARNCWPLLLPVAAAAGSARLSAGHGATVAVLAALAIGAALCGTVVFARRVSPTQLALVLFGVALGLMWSFSLRGHFVYGFDITKEYRVLASTYSTGVWNASSARNPYAAMLSLTVLPSSLHALTGLSILTLLKLVYPALFALFPVAVFGLARRFVRPQYAFIAAAFPIVQPYFFGEIPAVARQEIALLFFVVLLAAVLDDRLRGRQRWALITLFALGLVVSHYTTTYIAITILAGGVVVQLVVSLFRRTPRLTAQVLVALVVSVTGASLWYGVVTHSATNLSSFVGTVNEQGLDLLPTMNQGEGLLNSWLSSNTTSRMDATRYAARSELYAKRRSYIHPLPAAASARYALQDAATPNQPVRSAGPYDAIGTGGLVFGQLFTILGMVGALALAVGRRRTPGLRLVGCLGITTLAVLGFVRLSGTAANAYNQERALVQAMVITGICVAWLLDRGGRRWRRFGIVCPVIAAAALAVIFVSSTGLRAVAFGGPRSGNLADQGEDYERFSVSPPELASARWVAQEAPSGSLVYADRYGALRVFAVTGRTPIDVLTPDTLDRHGWVYASRSNVVDGRARGQFDSNYALYKWPAQFLDDQFAVVYTNGSSSVLHR